MLKKLKLTRYKGFKSFTVGLAGSVLLIGPNNAGKSISHAVFPSDKFLFFNS